MGSWPIGQVIGVVAITITLGCSVQVSTAGDSDDDDAGDLGVTATDDGAGSDDHDEAGSSDDGSATTTGDADPDDDAATEEDDDGSESDADDAPDDDPCALAREGTQIFCVDGAAYTCEGVGITVEVEVCESNCADGHGCYDLCVPSALMCGEDGNEWKCSPEGDGWTLEQVCDPVQGMACEEHWESGYCVGDCAHVPEDGTGCDFFAAVTPHAQAGADYAFGVIVTNPYPQPRELLITRGATVIHTTTVDASAVRVIELPWIDALVTTTGTPATSALVADGAYRIRSNGPVFIHQFSPLPVGPNLDAIDVGPSGSDGTLLRPATSHSTGFIVAGFGGEPVPNADTAGEFYAVIARSDETTVSIVASPTGGSIRPGSPLAASGTGAVLMDEGDVLLVLAAAAAGVELTGTLVEADKPIMVIGGHACAPTGEVDGTPHCGHLESTMPEKGRRSRRRFPPPGPDGQFEGRAVRATSGAPQPLLAFDPPLDPPLSLPEAGAWVDLGSLSIVLNAHDQSDFILAERSGVSAGTPPVDPSLYVSDDYGGTQHLLWAPLGDALNYLVVRSNGIAPVSVDGIEITDWLMVDGFEMVAVVWLPPTPGGMHKVEAGFGASVDLFCDGPGWTLWLPIGGIGEPPTICEGDGEPGPLSAFGAHAARALP